MKIIHKTAEELSVIIGVTYMTITNRTRSIRLREYVLNKEVINLKMDYAEAEKILSELRDKMLAGYNYEIKGEEGAGKKSTYIFFKNE